MWQELKRHERFVREFLAAAKPDGLAAVRDHHDRRVQELQHERLIHLLVTLFVALFALLATGWFLHQPSIGAAALAAILLILTAAYLLHYFRLENGVQRLYGLSRQLDERIAGRALCEPGREGGAGGDRGA
jgi:membrane-bound metal-dependent hydrolase YbcI (DUF457 family)